MKKTLDKKNTAQHRLAQMMMDGGIVGVDIYCGVLHKWCGRFFWTANPEQCTCLLSNGYTTWIDPQEKVHVNGLLGDN